jgi:hypothetical protein
MQPRARIHMCMANVSRCVTHIAAATRPTPLKGTLSPGCLIFFFIGLTKGPSIREIVKFHLFNGSLHPEELFTILFWRRNPT